MDRSWIVTEDGLETADGSYHIDSDRLGLERQAGISEWMVHMAEKTWVDMQEFGEKFRDALRHHGIDDNFNWKRIENIVNEQLLERYLAEIAHKNVSENPELGIDIANAGKLFKEMDRLKGDSTLRAKAPKVKYT